MKNKSGPGIFRTPGLWNLRWRRPCLIFVLFLLTFSLGAQDASGKRVALVIGNSAYEHTSTLKNPVNDAQDIGATLENLGFSVTQVFDANKGDIKRAVDNFQNQASQKGTAVALFYYSRPRGGV